MTVGRFLLPGQLIITFVIQGRTLVLQPVVELLFTSDQVALHFRLGGSLVCSGGLFP